MDSSFTKKELVASFVRFLDEELSSKGIGEDNCESLEVVRQCLESVYSIDHSDIKNAPLYHNLLLSDTKAKRASISQDQKKIAEDLKNQGNEAMKCENYNEAIKLYSEAIKIDPYNAVYLCNRAAAYSKLEKHQETITDCIQALEIDQNYSKAHSRIGLAYSSLGKHSDAVQAYKRCLELDPDNVSAKQNLAIAEARLAQAPIPGQLPANVNMEAVQQMAGKLMQDPNMQNLFSSFMSDALNRNQKPGTEQTDSAAAPTMNMQNLFSMGQQLLGNLQRDNPDLVNGLMSNIGKMAGSDSESKQES